MMTLDRALEHMHELVHGWDDPDEDSFYALEVIKEEIESLRAQLQLRNFTQQQREAPHAVAPLGGRRTDIAAIEDAIARCPQRL